MSYEKENIKKENGHHVTFTESDVEIKTARSSGPGGQNVNKVESKVLLRFNIASSDKLTEDQKAILFDRLDSKLTDAGELLITVQKTRSQHKNIEIALEKLNALIEKSLKPRKKRVPTKPGKKARQKRRKQKEQRSETKKLRKPPTY